MCGILGIFGDLKKVKEQEFQSALDAIEHRGPDDQGVQKFENAILGFRRLSIIDLSYNGHQPMSDRTGRYWIIFNGEIYNHIEIRSRLEKEGISFVSSTDTEVILYGYIKYGRKILDLLDGMFSFVIFDNLSGEAFAARDRMGKKPLLYYWNNGVLVFFSELKQIKEFSFFQKKINYPAVSQFLTYGAISSPMTIFEEVQQIEAGHYASFKDGLLSAERYWYANIGIDNKITYEEAVQRTHDLVEESIQKRLISDVPLGAFLSGGIDSSIITAIMAKHSAHVKTFSITYANAPQSYDESYYAGLIVKKYQTKHSTITVSPDDVYNDIRKIIWHMDQPSCDAINTYFVSKSARQGVTVALSGVGADEIFAGYSTFKFAQAMNRIRRAKNHKREREGIADRLFFSLPNKFQVNWKVRMLAGLGGAFSTSLNRYNLIKQIFRDGEIERLASKMPTNSENYLSKFFSTQHSNIQQITMAEVNNYLKNTLLRDSDIMGMASSLEIRSPFIDHNLIEFALTLPDDYKIQNLNTKRILKDAFKSYLPDEVLARKKMGFAFPLSSWLKKGNLRQVVEDCLSESSVKKRGLFSFEEVTKVKEAYFSLKQDSIQTYQWYQRVWMLVVLELWFREYID